MKKSILFLMALLLSLPGFAQYDNYKLSKYVNPDYKRQLLEFSFDLNGELWGRKTNQPDYIREYDTNGLGGTLVSAA